VSLVVNLAVLSWFVQVPDGSPVNVCEYVNVVPVLESVHVTPAEAEHGVPFAYAVPSVPPKVSVTETLVSVVVGVALLKSNVAMPCALLPVRLAPFDNA
jgi:hypothetical protein